MEGFEGLELERRYKLPIWVFTYNGKSIRSTLAIKDYDHAKRIAGFNDSLYQRGIKPTDYRIDSSLWVPNSLLDCGLPKKDLTDSLAVLNPKKQEEPTREPADSVETVTFPLLGKNDEVIDIRSDKLKNHIYYLVSGHGGPDPGAIGKYGSYNLCEDEYAYDVTLRLANNLIRHGAEVHVIVQDENDGIRNEAILPCDTDEKCYGSGRIPYNQLARLKQRADTINKLYRQRRKKDVVQRVIIFHVDSRAANERVDMFFYHASNSRSGKKMAESLRIHIDQKYGIHQRNRGYKGTVEARNLYMLKKTLPTSVYVELGNIRNDLDQKRFILESNRQAIANWFTEGVIKYEQSFMPKAGL